MTKRPLKKPVSLTSHRWLSYVAAGAATTVAGAHSVEGEIHYSGVVDIALHVNNVFLKSKTAPLTGGAYLDLIQVNSFTGQSNLIGVCGAQLGALRARGSYFASRIREGRPVSVGPFYGTHFPGDIFLLQNHYGSGDFLSGVKYVGFKFDVGQGAQYGWGRIQTFKNGSFQLIDYAWGDPGDAIKAGETGLPGSPAETAPSTGSLGLLALGGAGLLAWRQRRARELPPRTADPTG